MTFPFVKMHGLGNDFVIVNQRLSPPVTTDLAVALADRRRGVGCDQVLVLDSSSHGCGADCFMTIYNSDGSLAEACGNGTRCVAELVMREREKNCVTIETVAGLLYAWREDDGLVAVDMGPPGLCWYDVPLAEECDTLHVPVKFGDLDDGVASSMGNPHVTFFVSDAEAVVLSRDCPVIEQHLLFPKRVNVGVASLLGRNHLRLRVWERGVGVTFACGSGACAAAVASARRGITERNIRLSLDGGELVVVWREADGHVIMKGPATLCFYGTWPYDVS